MKLPALHRAEREMHPDAGSARNEWLELIFLAASLNAGEGCASIIPILENRLKREAGGLLHVEQFS